MLDRKLIIKIIMPKGGATGFLSSDLKHYCCPSFGSWPVQGKNSTETVMKTEKIDQKPKK